MRLYVVQACAYITAMSEESRLLQPFTPNQSETASQATVEAGAGEVRHQTKEMFSQNILGVAI